MQKVKQQNGKEHSVTVESQNITCATLEGHPLAVEEIK